MLHCSSRLGKGSKLIEPSSFVNNFISKNLAKFGVFPTPASLLSLLEEDFYRNISMSNIDSESPLLSILARPNYGNLEGLLENAKKRLEGGEDISATPKATALFLEWFLAKGEDSEISFNIEIEMDELAEAFAEAKNRSFVPYNLERLLKLFAIFYGKEVPKQIKFLSAIQLNMLDANKKDDLTFFDKSNFVDLIEVVESVKEKYVGKFSSNNLFNKVLEELNTAYQLQKEGYEEVRDNNILILKPLPSTLEESKEDFFKMIEG